MYSNITAIEFHKLETYQNKLFKSNISWICKWESCLLQTDKQPLMLVVTDIIFKEWNFNSLSTILYSFKVLQAINKRNTDAKHESGFPHTHASNSVQ